MLKMLYNLFATKPRHHRHHHKKAKKNTVVPCLYNTEPVSHRQPSVSRRRQLPPIDEQKEEGYQIVEPYYSPENSIKIYSFTRKHNKEERIYI